MFYLITPPWLLRKFYSECVWKIDTKEKNIYLTFDDGPHPEATPFILEQLQKYNAHATFFCIGENVERYFELYKRIIDEGHRVGNHTQHHLNGWKTKDDEYFEDVAAARRLIDSNLFRPPYGRITKFQLRTIMGKKLNLRPIMWSVLSGDFDAKLKPEECLLNVVKHGKAGSIIVFHDSGKAFGNLQSVLPKVLEHFSSLGYAFKSISEYS